MPRYFFNTRIGDELIVDPDGEDLRNPARAWQVAREMILAVLKSEGTQPALLEAIIEVTDSDGEIVLEFPFTEALLDMPELRRGVYLEHGAARRESLRRSLGLSVR